VAEDVFDEEDSLRRCGKRTVHRLNDAGTFVPDSVAAHCVHVDNTELAVLADHQVWMAHNCRSNMNNSVGYGPAEKFGDRAVLGTDGIDGDIIAESRAAYFRAREASLSAYAEQFTGTLARGCVLASDLFAEPIGRLQEGNAADLVVLDYEPPTPLSAENLAWHWMFALTAQHVRSVMVNGEWVIRDREFCRVDEEKVRAEDMLPYLRHMTHVDFPMFLRMLRAAGEPPLVAALLPACLGQGLAATHLPRQPTPAERAPDHRPECHQAHATGSGTQRVGTRSRSRFVIGDERQTGYQNGRESQEEARDGGAK